MSNKTEEKIVIEWVDAVFINQHSEVSQPATMITEGTLIKDYGDCLLVRNVKTKNKETEEPHPKKQPRFYCIPKELIVDRKKVE